MKAKVSWSCSECGHAQTKWSGNCPQCKSWNTLIEELQQVGLRYGAKEGTRAVPITEVKSGELRRFATKMGEFDRLLGGGIVEGSLVLIGGEPGIGKSTLMLQLARALAEGGKRVLYVSGEESAEQTALRAQRLGVAHGNIFLLSETNLSSIRQQVEAVRPDALVIDSIQIVYKPELPSSPGSVVQVREAATEFMHLAKQQKIATFLVGHITKGGELAGPKVLEHLVDAVLEFEGDRQHGFRLLRSLKNRFGPTDEIALFQMVENGLAEVPNPSEIFLLERVKEVSGSAIVPGLEGGRSFLLEIQALVTQSAFSTPARRSTGLDANRLGLLLAVLEKRVGFSIAGCDVFVALAGGLKIVEPALDLGILTAIASSHSGRAVPSDAVVFGEVGLSGEVRGVSRVEARLKEAIQMGFRTCVLPKKNLKGISTALQEKIKLVGVDLVEQAIRHLLG